MSFNGFCIGETDYFPRYVYKSDVLREENMSTVIEKWDEILELYRSYVNYSAGLIAPLGQVSLQEPQSRQAPASMT